MFRVLINFPFELGVGVSWSLALFFPLLAGGRGGAPGGKKFDLVVAAYSLSHLPTHASRQATNAFKRERNALYTLTSTITIVHAKCRAPLADIVDAGR